MKGKDLDTARKLIRKAGLGVEVVYEYTDDLPAGQVIDQGPGPHVVVDEGDVVRLWIARPLPRIPNVVGTSLSHARQILKHAGFEVGDVRKQPSSQPKGSVIWQSPVAGTGAQPGRHVSLVIAKPEPQASTGGDCTPGYSPCIPPGSDVDCAGGSGDGPRYVSGPVQVTGSDPYGLDADNDGVGCED